MVRLIASFVGAAVTLSQLANGAPGIIEGAAVIIAPGSSSFSSGIGSLGSSSLGSSSLGSLGSLGSSSLGSLGSSSSLGSLGSSSSLGSLGSLGSSSSLGSLGSSSSLGSLGSLGSSSSLGSLGSSSSLGSNIGSTFTPPSSSSSSLQFGSGSSSGSFNAAGFGTCVDSCIQQFGAPPSGTTISPSSTSGSNGGSVVSGSGTGTGVTKTVIVSPTQGVLRFVPFAVNASVGDTVRFIWGAGPHTVTKSSDLTVCNATLDAPFTSGRQNASFIFDQQVTTTDPTFFFCGVPTHCQKGMFGIINPPQAFAADESIGQSIQPLIAANPALEAAVTQTNGLTAGTSAANFGSGISVAGLSPEAQSQLAENVMFTRQFYAANPGVLEQGLGATSPNGQPLNIPVDPIQAFNAQNAAAASTAAPAAVATPVGGSDPAPLPPKPLNSGASSLAAKAVLAVVSAAAAAFFAL